MPDIPKYDGTWDLRDHIITYTTGINGNDLTKEEMWSVLVKKFGETLTKGALTWYFYLPKHSTSSFAELVDAFIKNSFGSKKGEKASGWYFQNYTREDRVTLGLHWQRERILLSEVEDNLATMEFTRNLNPDNLEASRRLKESLREFLAKIWNYVYHWCNTKLRIEEDISILPDSKQEIPTNMIADREELAGKRDPRIWHGPYPRPMNC